MGFRDVGLRVHGLQICWAELRAYVLKGLQFTLFVIQAVHAGKTPNRL